MGLFGKCCNHRLCGEILLGYGQYELEVDIPGVPCKVAFEIEDPADGCCVCHGDVNKIGITIGTNGFIINADIRTNTCLVKWNCLYKEE